MNFRARTLKRNSFIFGFRRVAQVGEASFLEVNLWRNRRRWAYHFYLVCFRPWDPTKPLVLEEDEAFFNNAKQDSETTTLLAAVRCCVTATLAA